MAGSEHGRFLRCGIVGVGLVVGGFIGLTRPVDARPLRGPIMRAERRVVRAQAALDRELARPPARPRAVERLADPAGDRANGAAAAAAGKQQRTTNAAPSPAPATQAAAPANAPAPAKAPAPVARDGVKQATFDAPSPTPVTAGDAARPAGGEPAADGTYSVLVRPEGGVTAPATGTAAQAGEPLRFPDASAP